MVRSSGVGAEGVELAGRITSEEHRLRSKILHRESKGVKVNSDRIITSKCTNGHKVLNKRTTNEDIIKMKRCNGGRDGEGAGVSDSKWRTIANNDLSRTGRNGWQEEIPGCVAMCEDAPVSRNQSPLPLYAAVDDG